MPFAFHVGAALAIASGVGLVALGLALLGVRPRRPAVLAFIGFAVLWGCQIVVANIGRMATDGATAYPWAIAFTTLLVPLYVPLLYLALTYPSPLGKVTTSPVRVAVLAVPALLGLLLMAAASDLYVEDVVGAGGVATIRPGPLFNPVSAIESVAMFALAGAILLYRLVRAEGDVARSQLALMCSALFLYLGNRASRLVLWGILEPEALASSMTRFDYTLNILAMVSALAVVLAGCITAYRRRDLPWRELMLASALVPLLTGVLESFARHGGVSEFDTVGLWRLLMVALLAYAIVRYHLFDIEVRFAGAAPLAAGALLAIVGLAAVWALAGDTLARVPVLGITASLGIVAVCVPAVSLGREMVRRAAPHVEEPDYLYKRKLDVYRAALEETQGTGKDADRVFLADLRRRLGISEAEHRVLSLMLGSPERELGRTQVPAAATKFTIERELGRGSSGRAVLARDTVLDRLVVLKQPLAPWMMNEEGRKLFLQEAKMAARINHPNVVQVYEVLPEADPPMLVLEYVEGQSLDELLKKRRVLSPDRVVALALDLLAGLDAIHGAGIVHRDLKPANILITKEGRAKVTDLGVAHPPPSFHASVTAAGTGLQPGSLAYMSPEQARGDRVDLRSDLYSVGVVLYQAASGRSYIDFRRASELKARQDIQTVPPRAFARDVPQPLADAILRALAKDPKGRFPSAAAMARALGRA